VLTRRGLIGAGAALVLAPTAFAADEGDLAYVRLGVGIEVLGAAFYTRAVKERRDDERGKALAHEREHLVTLQGILGDGAPTADDFDLSFPKEPLVAIGRRFETAFTGTYLGAARAVADPDLRLLFARLAACQSAHLAYWHRVSGGSAVGRALPFAMDIDRASSALEPYGI
jgi:ferritin-like protein